MLSDIEIAQGAKMNKVSKIASKLGLSSEDLLPYGDYIAKVPNYKSIIEGSKKQGKLILVTAMSPTKFGIGKTTVSIGLADALSGMKKNVCLALREPSLGPVFGVKGGAAGGGYSQVVPMEQINLSFTGDFDAITSANNLLSAMIDNHIFFGNELGIDPSKVLFHRCLDVNDRSLRDIHYTLACKGKNGEIVNVERTDNFTITAASEIMAICCLAENSDDLKERLGNIIVALDTKGKPVYAKQLKAEGSMAVLLKNALAPNLVQTLAHTPAFVHLGPFANIAHGCNSMIATKLALSLSDFVVTEAGFGSDLGAEKFLDLKCRVGGLNPNVVVLVSTIRGLKFHGGSETNPDAPALELLEKGMANLYHHIDTLKKTFKVNVVVTINKFLSDTDEEINFVVKALKKHGVTGVVNECFAKGGDGTKELANAVLETISDKKLHYSYELKQSVEKKIDSIVKNVYGGKGAKLSKLAKEKIKFIKKAGFEHLPVIIAKTQFSLSDNSELVGAPSGFVINVRDIELKAGAGFIVVIAGNMMLMPGLSKSPNAERINIESDGTITGLS